MEGSIAPLESAAIRAPQLPADASPLRARGPARLEERLGQAMRQLFPKLFSLHASRRDRAVAKSVYAFLAGARTVAELGERARLPLRYPTDLIRDVALRDQRTVLIRPVLPADAPRHASFVRSMSPTTRFYRFHGAVADLPDDVLRYLTEVDYVDHLALVAETIDDAAPRQLAEARWVRRADESDCADFAIAIADDYQRCGLGNHLLDLLERSAAERGVRRLCGHVLRGNRRMLGWLEARGWVMETDANDPGVVCAERALGAAKRPPLWQRSRPAAWAEAA